MDKKLPKDLIPNNINLSTVDALNQFSSNLQKSDLTEAIRQLFDVDKIGMITDLSKDEIRLITRMLYIGDRYNLEVFNKIAYRYMTLSLSEKRKSRSEILKAFSNINKGEMPQTGINPFNRRLY